MIAHSRQKQLRCKKGRDRPAFAQIDLYPDGGRA